MRDYIVNFRLDGMGDSNESTGFYQPKTAGYFEAGWDIELLYHDIFEHWFEYTPWFRTEVLSTAGECVAMGVRQYLYEHSSLSEFMFYNPYRGLEWNSIHTVLGEIADSDNGFSAYKNLFDFEHLPDWDGKILLEWDYFPVDHSYLGTVEKWGDAVNRALSYGYWLGEYMFTGRFELIYDFCSNLRALLGVMGPRIDIPFHASGLQDWSYDVEVKGDSITSCLQGYDYGGSNREYHISAEMGEVDLDRVITDFSSLFFV